MSTRHVEALDKQITALSDALARLGRGTTLADRIKIIHQPGWTTPAELAFAKTTISAMQTHVAAIETLQREVLSASKLVSEHKEMATS